MPNNYESTDNFELSLSSVNVLVAYAEDENKKGNDSNRLLFLKLSIVLMVSKFQVFVENVLAEFLYRIRTSELDYNCLPIHSRINSLKLNMDDKDVLIQLKNPEKYDQNLLVTLEKFFKELIKHCNHKDTILDEFLFNNRFPLGKTGTNELVGLFKQFEGKDIFENNIDMSKMDSLLNIRHNIIHQDANPSLTENMSIEYLDYLKVVSKFIDAYFKELLGKGQNTISSTA